MLSTMKRVGPYDHDLQADCYLKYNDTAITDRQSSHNDLTAIAARLDIKVVL